MILNIKKAIKEYINSIRPFFFSEEFDILSSKINNGMKAKNNIGSHPISGQENAKKKPLNIALNRFFIYVTNIIIFLLT
tara:strand:+ start:687 stop:923 length:237 start_codon:yes stop_codon:yes gene_type:complete